jgi:hypothetical protein
MSRIAISALGMWIWLMICTLPQRSHSMRKNQLGKAASGSPRASWPEGSGSVP